MAKTLYDKLIENHTIIKKDNNLLLYIDRHLIHEVTSPQAFENLQTFGRKVWRKETNLAVPDHNVSTATTRIRQTANYFGFTKDSAMIDSNLPGSSIKDEINDSASKIQIQTLDNNCEYFDINEIKMDDERQGIVHVVGPEQGFILPGTTVVCGDSHASTHGALGALAFGICTSEVEHILATNSLWQQKAKNLKIVINGKLALNISAKDLVLYIIGKIGTAGGAGFAIEFMGEVISELSIEGRMTLCNMAIEAGARVGLVAVDEKTIEYTKRRPMTPTGEKLTNAIKFWRTLKSDDAAKFDKIIEIDATLIKRQVTWGTSPEMVIAIDEKVPNPNNSINKVQKTSIINALDYVGLKEDTKIKGITINKVFIGSCTNARIEDLRVVADVLKGKEIAKNIELALIVPGSGLVKRQAEDEGLDRIFKKAGFEWRNSGCSMCLAMNDDKLAKKDRCASTSNRNFEGRQGQGSFTHLVSPYTAAKSAICGYLC